MTNHDPDAVAAYIAEIVGHIGPKVIPPDTPIDGVIENSQTGVLHVVLQGRHHFMHDGVAVRQEVTDGAQYWTAYKDGELIDDRLEGIE